MNSDTSPGNPPGRDAADVIRDLCGSLRTLASCAGFGGTASAGDLAGIIGPLTAASSAASQLAARLSDSPGSRRDEEPDGTLNALIKAAAAGRGLLPALREQADINDAVAAEAAWDLGTRHALAGSTPFGDYGPGDGHYADHAYEDALTRRQLAAILDIPGGASYPAAEAAARAYADAYGEIAGTDAEPVPLRYKPGQAATTASGRAGVLTGESTGAGHPVIKLPDVGRTALTREAFPAPLVLEFTSLDAVSQAVSRSSVIQSGDVLLVPAASFAVIQADGGLGLLPADSWAALIDNGRYAASVALARDHLGPRAEARPKAGRPRPSKLTVHRSLSAARSSGILRQQRQQRH
jgi:hypothetical protein